jgi:hypothetical protein
LVTKAILLQVVQAVLQGVHAVEHAQHTSTLTCWILYGAVPVAAFTVLLMTPLIPLLAVVSVVFVVPAVIPNPLFLNVSIWP